MGIDIEVGSAGFVREEEVKMKDKFAKGVTVHCADMTLHINGSGEISTSENNHTQPRIRAKWANRNQPRPIFHSFIDSVLPDQAVRTLVQQYIGYTLIEDARFEVAQWWYGSGYGKSVLADIVGALHVSAAVLNSPKTIGGFGTEDLIDASLVTLNLASNRVDFQVLKLAISGCEMLFQRKYKKSLVAAMTAKWLVLCDTKPSSGLDEGMMMRRLQMIHFEQRFEDRNNALHLLNAICKDELGGVLNWAVEGLVQVMEAGGFSALPEDTRAA